LDPIEHHPPVPTRHREKLPTISIQMPRAMSKRFQRTESTPPTVIGLLPKSATGALTGDTGGGSEAGYDEPGGWVASIDVMAPA
jgi:hypothetical protein